MALSGPGAKFGSSGFWVSVYKISGTGNLKTDYGWEMGRFIQY
jgi:hypothetical protein